MKIALTHEDADFDALASLLAVTLLDREVLPVLPNKVNPNGLSFLAVYGSDFPFVEMKNLPAEEIEKLTLVDTQVLPVVHGLDAACPVICFDRHETYANGPANWTYRVDRVGATVTILVEQIQKLGLDISPVWAALFLVGIYEETSSFTSADVSPRDLCAAAYLLSSGANLELVQQFLFRPLSSEQQNFYTKAVTVTQLMSLGLQTVSPGLLAIDAFELMKRYGFEGFPVVQDNRVLGLLTRRAVDRAMSHKLNLPASSLMMPGNNVVFPTDSVNKVRQVMMETGWGQIPVADQQTGKLIGIVTRTDLIRSLESNFQPQKYKRNLAFPLETLIPANRLALIKLVASQAREMRLPIYVVGGFVRDLILNKPSLDFDIVVEGDAIDLGRNLQRRIGGKLTTHTRFGTAKWFLPTGLVYADGKFLQSGSIQSSEQEDGVELPAFLDLVTARTEFYTEPSALPTVEGASIKLDIHRRDFTINTLALRLDGDHYGDLLDYWGGYRDLENGIIRVLHSLSFIDDPTRIMRAVRFEQRFGFDIEPKTLHLIRSALDLIRKLTGDRIHNEFEHCFAENKSARMFMRLDELGVLAAVHPDLSWDERMSNLVTLIPVEASSCLLNITVQDVSNEPWTKFRNNLLFGVWFSRLSPESLISATERIHHPKSETEHIQQAQAILHHLPGLTGAVPSAIVRELEGFSNMAVMIALTGSDNSEGKEILAAYLTDYRKVQSHFHGGDLIAAGIPPGPVYKQILGALRMGLLDGTLQTIDEERTLLASLISKAKIKHEA